MESAHCRTALLVCGYREGLEAACCILFLLLLQAASRLRGSSCPLCVLSAALAEPVVSTLPPCASMLRAAACCRGTPCAAPPALLAVACMGWLHRHVVCRPYGLACCCMHELAARMLSLFCLSLRAILHRAAPPCLFWWGATLGCANPRSTSAAARMQRGEPSANLNKSRLALSLLPVYVS